MKIAIITPWYTHNVGYSENFLPDALARLGHEVHLISSNAQIYYKSPVYKELYEPFVGPSIVETGVTQIDNYTLHRLEYINTKSALPAIKGLYQYLCTLKPDIVQTFDLDDDYVYEAARYAKEYGCGFFTENHHHRSVMSKDGRISLFIKAKFLIKRLEKRLRFIKSVTDLCFAISEDTRELAIDLLGFPKEKVVKQSLGVATTLFKPLNTYNNTEREELRRKLGFSDRDIVCIYTGRFSESKNPYCLAQAIDVLRKQGEPFCALFVGTGTPEEIQKLSSIKGCIVHPFVQVRELPQFYRAADIGVWPKEESTSQLDAVACGLPIIVSNKTRVQDRYEGNGASYLEDDPHDLAQKIMHFKDITTRKVAGEHGVKKIQEQYSWDKIAGDRVLFYKKSLSDRI